MRKIVEQFLKDPSPKLRKQLTSEELRYVQKLKKAQQKETPKPAPQKKEQKAS